jgi:hypothetical protein
MQHTCQNTQIHISHKITPLKKQTKQNKEKPFSSQSYTNRKGHITASEYSIEEENRAIPDTSLGGLLSCETSRLSHYLDNQFLVGS